MPWIVLACLGVTAVIVAVATARFRLREGKAFAFDAPCLVPGTTSVIGRVPRVVEDNMQDESAEVLGTPLPVFDTEGLVAVETGAAVVLGIRLFEDRQQEEDIRSVRSPASSDTASIYEEPGDIEAPRELAELVEARHVDHGSAHELVEALYELAGTLRECARPGDHEIPGEPAEASLDSESVSGFRMPGVPMWIECLE